MPFRLCLRRVAGVRFRNRCGFEVFSCGMFCRTINDRGESFLMAAFAYVDDNCRPRRATCPRNGFRLKV